MTGTPIQLRDRGGRVVFEGTQFPPGGGSQAVKHDIVPIAYTDIDTATGFADLYLLPETGTVVASWPVITVGFDGTDSGGFPLSSVQAFGPGGNAAGAHIGDTFDASGPSAVLDGLIGPDPGSVGGSVVKMFPLMAPEPGGGSVQLVLDFAQGNVPLTTGGSQGQLDYHLVIAVAP